MLVQYRAMAMREYPFVTVDVFTDRRFGGNQLAVLPDATGLSDEEMQAIAAEFNFSETTFVLPPANPAHTARVRIFHRTAELPFAGHPNVGTGFVLAGAGRDVQGLLRFEELAGVVDVRVRRNADGTPSGATIAAPQPLALGPEIAPTTIAACAGLEPDDVCVDQHPPIHASMGNPFILAEVTPDALSRATPDLASFRRAVAEHPDFSGRFSLHLYTRTPDCIRARMFAPLARTYEDPATGSANAPLGGLLLSLSGAEEGEYTVLQGVEMGRPSRLEVTARRSADGIRATVGGSCVQVTSGSLLV
jgi:trans-2,3-dihydro-3-hydroxyanthranilate isomerase